MTTITDTLKQMVDELEIEKHVAEMSETAEKAARDAITKAGEFAHAHTADLEQLLARAGSAIDDKTDGRWSDAWTKVSGHVTSLWGMLADQRSAAETTDVEDPAELEE